MRSSKSCSLVALKHHLCFQIRNTRIDLLEEELRLLRENMRDSDSKNKGLEDEVARFRLELSQSQDQLLSMEEVKQHTVQQCNATRESLDSTQSQVADLSDQITRLNYLLEEEKRKKRLAEERYSQQQEEYDSVLRKRQKELETVSWSKMELEKSLSNKDHEIAQLQRQLAEEADRIKELQKEVSKVRSNCSVEINNLKLSYESQIHDSRTDIQRLAAQKEEDATELKMRNDRVKAEMRSLEDELRRFTVLLSESEEQRKRAEEEVLSQRAVITEEGRRRRQLENQLEVETRQREAESSQFREKLEDFRTRLQGKSEEVSYVTHSLEEEIRRRRTVEDGQDVLEKTLAQLQVKLASSSGAANQLEECKEELQRLRLELDRESREKSRVEQNMIRIQGRLKDIHDVRDGLESQVENLRKSKQEEVNKRKKLEADLENTMLAVTEYTGTIASLRQTQEQASRSGKRGEEERQRIQAELERSLRQSSSDATRMTQLSKELKALQQQLLQEQSRVKEANLKNQNLYISIEEKSKTLDECIADNKRLKQATESLTKDRLKLEEELQTARRDKDELKRTKQACDDELASQIHALEMQLQASERTNTDYRNLVSELSSETEKLKTEAEKIQSQATEVHGTLACARLFLVGVLF